MKSGVYKIQHKESGRLYVGSSTNVRRRLIMHKCMLNKNKHFNRALQRAVNKYSLDAFSFEKILVCSNDDLLMYEQLIMDGYKAYIKPFGYNLRSEASSNSGIPMSEKTRKAFADTWLEGGSLEKRIKYRPGNRYGNFILVHLVKKDNGKRNFLCLCDCGREWITSTVSIANGMVSCGCLNPQRFKRKPI